MILLTGTTDLVTIITSAATNVDVHASWIDNNAGTITPGRTNTPITTAATTTVVGSPAASTQRNVKYMSIRNRDATVTNTVTVKLTDGTNNMEMISVALAAGEELHFTEGTGFVTYSSGGVWKQASSYLVAGGTTTLPSLRFSSGVIETSPKAGDVEYDGVIGYFTPVVSERGVLGSEHWQGQTAARTLVSQTAAQKLFNTGTSGLGTLNVGANRTYQFECMFDLSSMSATTGSFGFNLGGTAVLTTQKWLATASKAALATAIAPQSTLNTAANLTLATGTTATVGWAWIRGIVRVGTGGTIIPQVSLEVAAAAVVGINSFFRAWAIGVDTQVWIGSFN